MGVRWGVKKKKYPRQIDSKIFLQGANDKTKVPIGIKRIATRWSGKINRASKKPHSLSVSFSISPLLNHGVYNANRRERENSILNNIPILLQLNMFSEPPPTCKFVFVEFPKTADLDTYIWVGEDGTFIL